MTSTQPKARLTDDERATLLIRRVAAFFSSFLISPGAGHLAMGRRWRALLWFALATLTVLPGPLYSMWAFWANFPLRVLAGVDAALLPSPAASTKKESLPRWGAVIGLWALLMAATFGLKIAAQQVYLGVVADDARMAPAVEVYEQVLASRLDRTAPRGALIVFVDPKDKKTLRLGRVLAVAGESITLSDGRPSIDGHLLSWKTLPGRCRYARAKQAKRHLLGGKPGPRRRRPDKSLHRCTAQREQLGAGRYTVLTAAAGAGANISMTATHIPAGHVFVVGDNRAIKTSAVGSVALTSVVGRLRGIWWSSGDDGLRWDRIGLPLR